MEADTKRNMFESVQEDDMDRTIVNDKWAPSNPVLWGGVGILAGILTRDTGRNGRQDSLQ